MAVSQIIIRGSAEISALGHLPSQIAQRIRSGETAIALHETEGKEILQARLPEQSESVLQDITRDPRYRHLDRSTHLAIFAARQAMENADLEDDKPLFVNLGSSRGATSLLEKHFRQYISRPNDQLSAHTSPSTTLGNLSSWVLQDLAKEGYAMSHSMTCSTGLQAIANAIAWLKSGMCERALVGASEAPLTGFTLSQMRALQIYASQPMAYPCQPCALERLPGSGLVLGEGAAVHVLELGEPRTGDIRVLGIGLATEQITSPTSMSADGEVLYKSMSRALADASVDTVDAVVLHAPGTVLGDAAEMNALERLFTTEIPACYSNKWLLGHTFAAAGNFNIQYAKYLLRGEHISDFPYRVPFKKNKPARVRTVLVNASGFGGGSASVILGL